MACCAFALFILGQIAAGLVALRRAVPFGLLGRPDDGPVLNPSTAWQLGGASTALALVAAPRRPVLRRLGGIALVAALLELGLLAAGGASLLHASDASADTADASRVDTLWCGGLLR